MKKILGILTICFVCLFMLASCGSSNDNTTNTNKPTNELPIQVVCEDCEITLKVNERYYLVEYFTDEYVAYVEKITGATMDYNMYVLAWDEESFKLAEKTDSSFCNIYVKIMFILDDFYYIGIETKQEVGLCITSTSTARKVIDKVKTNMGSDYAQTKIATATDYYMFRLPINEVSYTIK